MIPALRAAYLARLGLEAEPPSIGALQRLHARHVERIPYETLWIHAGERWGIDPDEAAHRIAFEGRGGYCYHLNGALGELLASLGYDVHRHVGAVHGEGGPDAQSEANHLVLTVAGLPTQDHPSGVWYVDVGLGDALHQALPLASGVHRQGPFALELRETADGWHLTHDPRGGFVGMGWTSAEARWEQFAAKHEWLSTSPESGFVRIGMAERRDATGVDVVRGLVVHRIGSNPHTSEPLTDRDAWFAALRDVAGLDLASAPASLRERLWARMLADQRAWEAGDAGVR